MRGRRRLDGDGNMLDGGGWRSGRRGLSPSSGHPSRRCFHLEDESGEAELLDTAAELKVAPVTGDLRGNDGGSTARVRVTVKKERRKRKKRERGEE